MNVTLRETSASRLPRERLKGLLLPQIVLVFVALIVLAELLGIGKSLLNSQPHPFWIPVLLFSVLGGLAPGIISALLASVLDWLLGDAVLPIGFDFYDYLLASVKEPALWIGAAAVIGGITRHQRVRTEEAFETAERFRMQRATIADYAGTLRDQIRDLELAAALRADESMGDFRATLKNMKRTRKLSARHKFLKRACQIATGCETAVVFRRGAHSWRLVAGANIATDLNDQELAEFETLSSPRVLGKQVGDQPRRIAIPFNDKHGPSILLLDGCPAENDTKTLISLGEFIAERWVRRQPMVEFSMRRVRKRAERRPMRTNSVRTKKVRANG